MLKRCFKCGADKERSEFYAHPQMADGLLGKCKDCTKLDMRVDRHTKPRVREYDRERSKLPHRASQTAATARRWRAQHRDGYKAHTAANNAERDGKLQKPAYCEGCGLQKRIEKHHPDYGQPLLVVWLCKPCHAIADKIRRKLETAF
jgi:hypothetical protein